MFNNMWFGEFMDSLNGPLFPVLVWAIGILLMSIYLVLGKVGNSFRKTFSNSHPFYQFLMGFFLTIIFVSILLGVVVSYADAVIR